MVIILYMCLEVRGQVHLIKIGDTVPMSKAGAESEDNKGIVVIERNSKKLKGRVEVIEELLPGIPNDITLDVVVPKLPWTTFHDLAAVSNGWQQVVHNHQVYDARVRHQSRQTLIVMNHNHIKNDGTLALFSLTDGSHYDLPPIPGFKKGLPKSCQCSSLDGKLYVLGGYEDSSSSTTGFSAHASPKTYVFDLVGKRLWKQCASMGEGRGHFGCGVLNGKIYVFGGTSDAIKLAYCGSEVYDPESDAWCPIAPMTCLGLFQQVVTMGEEFFVHREFYSSDCLQLPNYEALNPLEIYNPRKNQWRSMAQSIKVLDEVLLMAGGKLLTLRDRMYTYDICANSWKFLQLFSFGVFGARDSSTVRLLAAVAVDDEILMIVNWTKRQHTGEEGTSLMRIRGLGSKNQEIEWHKTQCSLSFDGLDFLFLCPIQL